MRHFPIYLDMKGKLVVLSGAGPVAVPKLRLLLKTSARIRVFGFDAEESIRNWAAEGRLEWLERELEAEDLEGATLLYCANDDEKKDSEAAALGARAGTLVNVVDNLEASEFITPAIVDRDPVTVAIGTEGSAPVLARKIKADVETQLPISLGVLAREGQKFREAASALRPGRERREFWSRYFSEAGPRALASGGRGAVQSCLRSLLREMKSSPRENGKVAFVGVGPGDPDLMTVKARRFVDKADVVVHDRSVPKEILELARREAEFVEIGDGHSDLRISEFGAGQLVAEHARKGALVARLVLGDLEEHANVGVEMKTVAEAGLDWEAAKGMLSVSPEHVGVDFPAHETLPSRPGPFARDRRNGIAAFAANGERAAAVAEIGQIEGRRFGRATSATPVLNLRQSKLGNKISSASAWRKAPESAA